MVVPLPTSAPCSIITSGLEAPVSGALGRHSRLHILDYLGAASLLSTPARAASVGALIAIHGQREYPVEAPGVAHRLVLRFDDTEVPSRTDFIQAARIRMRQREAAAIGLVLAPPT